MKGRKRTLLNIVANDFTHLICFRWVILRFIFLELHFCSPCESDKAHIFFNAHLKGCGHVRKSVETVDGVKFFEIVVFVIHI